MEGTEEGEAQPEEAVRLLLCDVDGTLLVDGKVDPADIDALRGWQASGGLFGLVTGRGEVFCRNLLEPFGLVPDCLVTDNGARVFVGHEVIARWDLDADAVRRSLEIFDPAVCKPFVTMEDGWNYFPWKRFAGELEYMKVHQPGLEWFASQDLDQKLQGLQGVPSVSVHVTEDGLVPSVLALAREKMPEFLWQQTSHDYVEASAGSKADAVRVLLDHLGLADAVMIGDGPNDIPVFELLEESWCMERADASVRRFARHCAGSVAEVLERMES